MMRRRLFEILACAAMALRLVPVIISPAAAEAPSARVSSRLTDHIEEFRAALIAKGVSPDARLTLAAPDAAIETAPETPLTIESATFNAATGRFLIRARGGDGAPLIAVAGLAATLVTLPVLARALDRNETISEEDIGWAELPDAAAGAYVDDADLLIGKVARRPLPAGQPLRKMDVQSPVLIKRGETATIVLEAPGLRLTQAAVALGQGGAGDILAFRNINSDREIKAVVAAKGVAKAAFRANETIASLEP
jgi:flagella basal body P-ring formation protein FlgA